MVGFLDDLVWKRGEYQRTTRDIMCDAVGWLVHLSDFLSPLF